LPEKKIILYVTDFIDAYLEKHAVEAFEDCMRRKLANIE
jgi:hypothetical protein